MWTPDLVIRELQKCNKNKKNDYYYLICLGTVIGTHSKYHLVLSRITINPFLHRRRQGVEKSTWFLKVIGRNIHSVRDPEPCACALNGHITGSWEVNFWTFRGFGLCWEGVWVVSLEPRCALDLCEVPHSVLWLTAFRSVLPLIWLQEARVPWGLGVCAWGHYLRGTPI